MKQIILDLISKRNHVETTLDWIVLNELIQRLIELDRKS